MPPTEVRFAPGAEENGLACMIAELVRENLRARPEKEAILTSLRGRVGVTARDADVSLTLELDGDGLTVHDGLRPDRALTITTDSEKVTDLSLLDFLLGIPSPFSRVGCQVVGDLLRGRLRIEGLLRHPILLIRLTRIISIH